MYKLTGALSYGGDGAEFYWNVTGNDWTVPIKNANAIVQSQVRDIFVDRNACYQGGFGNTDPCDEIRIANKDIYFSANNLSVGEGLTVAVGINPNKVAFLTTEKVSYTLLLGIFILLWFIFSIYKVYRFRIKNRVKKPVIAQYEPYKDYLPMYTGVLFDGRLDPKDITAGIIYLAEQGFIKIKRTEKKVFLFIKIDDYEITLLRPLSEIPTEFLKEVFGLLFDKFDQPPKTVLLSQLAKKRVENAKIIRKLNSSLRNDLKSSGFTVSNWPSFGWWLLVVPGVIFIVASIFSLEGVLILSFFMIIPTIILIVFILVVRRTKKGYEAENHLKGFKLFLSVTDEERFTFHNAPEKSPELFMKYLPYAVALGVEKEWAKVFEGITIPQPDWYEGGSMQSFSAVDLTHDIGAFSSSFTTNSGTSGSSGGGSSGGGGGGGGGGSW